MVFVAHTRMPESEHELLRRTILSWSNTENNSHAINALGTHMHFVPYDRAAYENIKKHYEEWKNVERTLP
jgi:hypothetical protein